MDALFPTHPVRKEDRAAITPVETPLSSKEDLKLAAKTLLNKKASGPDGIPVGALKVVACTHLQLLLNIHNCCLRAGIFYEQWKIHCLVFIISKGKGDCHSPSAYRPLCMLNTAGKLLENMIKALLFTAIQTAGDLSARHYGFEKVRFTIHAIQEVMKNVDAAQ